MSIYKRVLRNLQRAMPDTCLCRNTLAVAPTERIFRGFVFEPKIQKGRCYFRPFVMPLYSPKEGLVILSYYDRVPKETFTISEENVDEISEEILELISDGHLDYLRSVGTPADFFEHMNQFPTRHHRPFKIDLALTNFMLGNVRECKRILEEAFSVDDGLPKAPWDDGALALLEDLKTNPANASLRVEGWERANVEKLDLAKAMGKIA